MTDELQATDGQLATMAESKAKLLEALQAANGVALQAYEACGVPPTTYYRYIREDQVFADAVKALNNERIEKRMQSINKPIDIALKRITEALELNPGDEGYLANTQLAVVLGILMDKQDKIEKTFKPQQPDKPKELPTPPTNKEEEDKEAQDVIAKVAKYLDNIHNVNPTQQDNDTTTGEAKTTSSEG